MPRPAEGYFRQHVPIVLCGMPAEVRIRRDQACPVFHAFNGWMVIAQKVNGLYHHSPKQRLMVTSTRTTVPETRMVAGRLDETGTSSLTDGPQRGVPNGPLASWCAPLRFIGNTRPC